jgi:hypothetical protein
MRCCSSIKVLDLTYSLVMRVEGTLERMDLMTLRQGGREEMMAKAMTRSPSASPKVGDGMHGLYDGIGLRLEGLGIGEGDTEGCQLSMSCRMSCSPLMS